MTTESSMIRICWSVAYLCVAIAVLKVATAEQPLASAAPQQRERRLEAAYSRNPQIRVGNLKMGQESRQFNEEFEESDDWPKRLSFEVENISAKPITYLQVNLKFPETRISGNLMVYPIVIGLHPSSRPVAAAVNALRLMPGEKLQIAVGDHYAELETFIQKRHSMNQIHRAEIEIGFIVFEDGTAWAAGDFLRPDPNNPRHYINVGPKVPS